MKKIIALTLAALTVFALAATLLSCSHNSKGPYVYVTLYDGKDLAVKEEKVYRKDEDEDGKWTINDALISLHKNSKKSKDKDGFATVQSDYGLFTTKLWGIENGGAYGYYKNNKMCMSLLEELSEEEPDHLYAFVYSDTEKYSDAYSFFDVFSIEGKQNQKVKLTLKYISGFDENGAPVESPLADATVCIQDKKNTYKTDENGVAEIELPAFNTFITAKKEGVTLIPPICHYKVEEVRDDLWFVIGISVITVLVAAGVLYVIIYYDRKKRKVS